MARNIYNILRLGTQIKSRRLKLLGIWLFHVLGKRYIGIFLDPVLACNFRCKMCYFSDEQKRKSLRGTLKYEEIEAIAGSLFHRASETSSRLRSGTDFTQGLGKNHCTGQTIQRPLRFTHDKREPADKRTVSRCRKKRIR